MNLIDTISTPWTPYSVMFSHDGDLLAIGGGTWYGMGDVLLVSWLDGTFRQHPVGDILPHIGKSNLTASGVSFSGDDRFLAVSTWGPSWHGGPTFLFAVDALNVSLKDTLIPTPVDEYSRPQPTGVITLDDQIVVRNNTSILADVFTSWKVKSLQTSSGERKPHLTSSRIAIAGNSLLTGGGGSLALGGWRRDVGYFEAGHACSGLATLRLDEADHDVRTLAVEDCRRVTAIASLPSGNGFLTGGLDGEIDMWTWKGEWVPKRLRKGRHLSKEKIPEMAWATYTPTSVVGICFLGGKSHEHWASIDAVGELSLWHQDTCRTSWQSPGRGSPRSLASHPERPLLAIAFKKGSFSSKVSESFVQLLEITSLA